jgi:hypothetical protein
VEPCSIGRPPRGAHAQPVGHHAELTPVVVRNRSEQRLRGPIHEESVRSCGVTPHFIGGRSAWVDQHAARAMALVATGDALPRYLAVNRTAAL